MKNKILLIAVASGLGFWVIDSVVDHLIFYKEADFLDVLTGTVSPIEIYMRIFAIILFTGIGIIISWMAGSRNQAEKKLQESEERMKLALEGTDEGLWEWDVDTGQITLDENWQRVLGYTPGEVDFDFNWWESSIHPDSGPVFEAALDAYMSGREKCYELEYQMRSKTGDWRWIWTRGICVARDKKGNPLRMIGTHRDITEHTRVKSAQRLSNRFLQIANKHTGKDKEAMLKDFVTEIQNFTGCSAVGIRILDEAGNIPYQAHTGFNEHFFASESALSIESDRCMCINVIKGTTDASLPFYTEDGSFYMNGTTRFLATISDGDRGETRNVCNESGYESVALVPIRALGRIFGLIHFADEREDMVPLETVETLERTADHVGNVLRRMEFEEQLSRTNRAYQMLTECNQVMMRASNEDDLLYDVCRIIVETGGYRLVWVGLAEQDEAKSVRPVAQAGYEEGYLETLAIAWSDTGQGGGHTGTAIRTGRPCVARNIRKDPAFAPWRAAAIERGYESSAALPLIGAGEVLGAVNIYSSTPDTFNEDEMQLLQELADDVAHGLMMLRIREARDLADEALRESEDRFRAIADYTCDWEAWIGVDGQLLWVNPTVEEITGYSVEECLMMADYPLPMVSEEDRECVRKIIEEATNQHTSGKNIVFRILCKDGSFCWGAISWQPIYDSEGTCLGYRSSIRDITERKHMEQQLQVYTQNLEQLVDERTSQIRKLEAQRSEMEALAATGRMAAAVAHEINNPLAGIKNSFLVVADAIPSDHEDAHFVDLILREIDRISAIVRQMYELYQTEPQKAVAVDPATELEGVCKMLESKLKQRSLRLVLGPIPALPTPMLPEGQIRQILYNLIMNAIEASIVKGEIRLGATDSNGVIRISVSDDGPGIPSEVLKNIFEPFFTTKKRSGDRGMGLGLSVSQSLARSMGGDIVVETEVGKGTTFTLVLPCKTDTEKSTQIRGEVDHD